MRNNKLTRFIKILAVAFLIQVSGIQAQVVYQHVNHSAIYDFLDEMANMKYIELNSAIKPYSRNYIADKLLEINSIIMKLNKRQLEELNFFIKEYNKEISNGKQVDYITKNYFGQARIPFNKRSKRPDLAYYRDSTFMFSVNPILGVRITANDSGSLYHRWNGAEMMFYAGSHVGVYANLRDNYQSKAVLGPEYLVQETGGGFKTPTYGFSNRSGVEYSEMRGGITVNGNWWNLGLVKEHNVWGNNYNGANIFTSRAPSFAQIKLNMKPVKWFELNYFHGWLSSKVVDSAGTQNYGTGTTTQYLPKYIAANFVTIRPVRNMFISVGNSIIYSQNLNAGYLIPVMFYKSLDHTYSTLGNSQMYIDLSVRNIRNCHFYFTGYADDFSFGRLFETNSTKPWSIKVGGKVSNIISNVSVTAEYTRNNVLAYKHFNPETTYESTKYNMGHYLRDNAQEYFFQVTVKPLPKLSVDAGYLLANKGPDYPDIRNETDPVTGDPIIYTYRFQERIIWEKSSISLQARYEFVNDFVIQARMEFSDITDANNVYSPERFQGNQLITSLMMTFGF